MVVAFVAPGAAQDGDRHSPIVHAVVALPDGTTALPHRGVTSPVETGAVAPDACAFARVAVMHQHPRRIHVYGYVVGNDTYYDQADFVDPATGRLAGGVDGTGRPWRAPVPTSAEGCAER